MEQANFYNFAGRHAVITGGAAGIGLAIAQRLAAGGASLTLWDRDAALLQAAKAALGASARVQCVTVDVSSVEQVEAARDATVEGGGPIDILINSAGITGPNATVCDYPVADWDQVMAVNLRGPFRPRKAIRMPPPTAPPRPG
jgi:NAD(P)-dependent dehydrogenase (short-subunit alcohol dehydrogenase family)